jgi:capsular exopolysaccharide synthesis family protein
MIAASEQQGGLATYLAILRKRRKLVLIAVLVVPIAAYVYSILQPPAYTASSEVLLSQQNIAATLTGLGDPGGYQLSDRPIHTQRDLARVPQVVENTLRAAKQTDWTVQDFLASSSVSPRLNSDILKFTVTATEPWVAERLATAYAREFTRYRLSLDTAPARRARAQLQSRINQLRENGETSTRLYADLRDKEQQLATFEALQTSNAYVVRTALSATQVAPTPMRNAVLGLAVGLMLGVALAAVAHALDTGSRKIRSLEHRLGVPLLARIPAPPRDTGPLVMRTAPLTAHAEAFRVLRANLDFVNRSESKVFMTTSAEEGEGKSTTIANLAIAHAREGKRVIVVDLDLRRPTIATLFDVDPRPGVIEAAYGRVPLERALKSVPSGAPGRSLQVLGSDPRVRELSEFTASRELRALIQELRERADLVFIDAPPLLVSSDAITIGGMVDGIVFVTRQANLEWGALDDVTRALSMCAAPTLGWVLTGSEALPGYAAYVRSNGREAREYDVSHA